MRRDSSIGSYLALAFVTALAVSCANSTTTHGVPDGDDTSGTPTATPTGTPGGLTLSDGAYTYAVSSAPENTCWGPSKNTPALPMTIAAQFSTSGATVTVTTTTQGGTPQTLTLTRTDTSLTGSGAGDADFHSNGIDCVLHVSSTFDGTITANDTFSATQNVDIAVASGSGCNTLIGSFSSSQFDALPCTLSLAGIGTKN